ncbi:type II toxin-antitoxin system HicB family antitoxin [Candidatus Bathyarchaeota archaeon A05DMB-2]|jgi:predicted RNase H-like HicB family nuclease|nr:type II toxin-antitoxin system HicB family antitoxin [Candidatus Bathyarchaeota archaeon A05DMB-2]
MTAHKFTAFYRTSREGGFVVKCLELPVASQGETREEALANIKGAIEGYLEAKTKLLYCGVEGEKVDVAIDLFKV